jgi:hypothetical protein
MKEFPITLDLVKRISNPKYQIKQSDVDSVKFTFTLNNNDIPVDLTGTTLRMAVLNPIKEAFGQDCVITDAGMGQFECLLDETTYHLLGDYSAEISWYTGTETNTSYEFYFETIESIPLS